MECAQCSSTKGRENWKECLGDRKEDIVFFIILSPILPSVCMMAPALSLNKGEKAAFCVCVCVCVCVIM